VTTPIRAPTPLERGREPWLENPFYFEVLDASRRIRLADARVESWLTYLRKKRDEAPEDRWTDLHPPRSRPSVVS